VKVRTTKTGSGATAVQVVRYEQGKTVILKHIGSSEDPTRISQLKEKALDWIIKFTHQQTLFAKEATFDPLFTRYRYLGVRYNFLYETLNQVFKLFDFDNLSNRLLLPSSSMMSLPFTLSLLLMMSLENVAFQKTTNPTNHKLSLVCWSKEMVFLSLLRSSPVTSLKAIP